MSEETIKERHARLSAEWQAVFETELDGPMGGWLGAMAEEDLLDDVSTLLAENRGLRKLSDTAITAALTLNKQVGAELIRFRTKLAAASTKQES